MKKLLLVLFFSLALYAEEIYATFDVLPLQSSKLALSSSGIVKTIYVDIQDSVKRGQILLELDNQDLKKGVELARADYEKAKKEYAYAKSEFERYQKVSDVIQKELVDKYRFEMEIKEKQLKRFEANLALQEALLEKSFLRAPFDGVIAERFVEVGEGIAGVGSEAFLLMSRQKVKLVLAFDEKYWSRVKPGQLFVYRVDGEEMVRQGTITKVYPAANAENRKIKAEVLASGITPGLFGEGTIKVE